MGYIGENSAETCLLELLKTVEHKGYDSCGLAIQTNVGLKTTKTNGKISDLKNIENYGIASTGIAHTRWATHGKPSVINAHPHMSNNKEWVIVHNGIIENYSVYKDEIKINSSIKFVSETDSEVIAQMMEFYCQKDKPIKTLINVCNKLEGAFAIACVNQNLKNHLLLAKKRNPLYVAKNNNEIFVASDTITFENRAEEYYELNDDEFCDASKDKLVFYDKDYNEIKKHPIKIEAFESEFDKKEFSHFMLKEIYEIPNVLKKIVKTYKEKKLFKKISPYQVINFRKIALIGCGTAYHAAMIGAMYFEKHAQLEAKAYVASEFRYSNPKIDKSTLYVFISQSGETSDTIVAQELVKEKGAFTIVLTNVMHSTLAKKGDLTLPVCAGPEIAVASTKAYNAQITILYMLAIYFENILFNKKINFNAQIERFAKQLKIPNNKEINELANELTQQKMTFFIGRNLDYVTCEEASLKLKETTYINSNAYPSGELKHGFLALIENGIYLFVIATEKELLNKTLNGAHEAYARGAKVVLATQFKIPKEKQNFVHKVLKLQNFSEDLMQISSVITFQILSYYTSIGKNINPDQPRNLSKSVTVE